MAERSDTPSGAPNRDIGVPTFSFNVGNPTSQAQPTRSAAPLRGGVRATLGQGPASVARGGIAQGAAMASADLDALLKFGQGVLGKKMQEAQDAAYWEGVKKAATGASIQEVIEEQPWYSRIFGDSPMVEGARAYTAQANLDRALADLSEDMPNLRKMSPDEVTQVFVGRLDGMMTGDTMTDAVLKRSASEKLPLLLKQHAKEHYGYLQTNLREAQFTSWQPVAAGLQATSAGWAAGTVSDDDWKVQRDRALSSLAPLDGQTEDSYRQNMLAMYSKSAQDGNFQMVRLLDEAGVRKFFTPEQQRTLDDQIFRYSQRAKAQYVSDNMAEDVAALRAASQTGAITPREAAEGGRLLNQRFRRATGIDEDVVSVESITTQAGVQLYQDTKRTLTQQQMTEQKMTNAQIAFAAGYGSSAYADTGLSKTEADTAFRQTYSTSKNPIKLLVDNATLAPDPFVSPSIAGEIRATVQGSIRDQYNPGMENAYQSWKTLAMTPNGGEATAMAYYGTYHSQFQAMDALISRGTPADMAYDRVFNQPVTFSADRTKANTSALEEGIKAINQYDGWKSMFTWLGARPLSEAGVRGLTAVLGPKFDQHRQIYPDGDPTEAAKAVAKAAVANKEIEMYGEYAWGKDPRMVELSTYVGPVKEWASEAISESISTRLAAQGATNVQDYTIWRGPDTNGDPIIYVQAMGGGDVWNVVVRGSEVKALYDKNLSIKKGSKPTSAPAIGNRDWGSFR